ncbi:hypothetical protein [Streptomyces sp. AN091965]|uniref:hypothetical protein n=1 Tax=Streptomyces sp. AN091965 TaxID=2927803 RepID=UPI001F6175CA|nr:hypothetical protein [Streptomyces sp. AN091965]MCI3930196.1 hypothetical protein [Streptomyces sp. AN091965]
MPSRTRTRKTSSGVHTVRIPRGRGRRGQPFVVIVPERPTLTLEALGVAACGYLWRARTSLYPTVLAVLGFVLAAVLHVLAWWSCFLPGAGVVAPLAWLAVAQRSDPAAGAELALRAALASALTLAALWLTAAMAFGPTTGPLELIWLLALIGAQAIWLIIRRTSN